MSIAKFKAWMAEATVDEKKELAIKAGTKLITLYHIQQGYRNASAAMGAKIEDGIKRINRRKRHTPLPDVQRGDLCETCSKCKFYKEGDCK